jgi:MinD-like ATPase involved in chromosome partitioning or flagellar assembly
MKVIVASSAVYLKDCVSSIIESSYSDGGYEVAADKSELVRHLVSKEFKLVIITNDFESDLNYEKIIKSYANTYNYIVFINDGVAIKIDNKFVRVYDRTLTMDDLKDIFSTAYILYDRITQNMLPQLDNNQVISLWSINPRNLKTTIAQSLAYSIARSNPDDQVIVVGMSIDNPALAHLIRSEGNMFDVLIPTIENGMVDETVLSGTTYVHTEFSNLHILGGLDDKNLFNSFTEKFAVSLITTLKERYKYIILDTGSSLLSIPSIMALRNSDLIINVIDKDITSFIYGWKSAKQMMKSFGISASHMVSIINQFYPNDIYSDAKVQSHVGLYNMGSIPNLGGQVADAMVKKRILLESLDSSKESKMFERLISELHTYITKDKPKVKTGFFAKLFGGE